MTYRGGRAKAPTSGGNRAIPLPPRSAATEGSWNVVIAFTVSAAAAPRLVRP